MKIERLNDNQIRCTLTREDLAERQIRISELAYGSQKAKDLFRDMMQQAFQDFGFEVENTPLMIEAIPLSADSIVFIVTKVDDPEELDSRFARFSPEDGSGEFSSANIFSGADDILDMIAKLTKSKLSGAQTPPAPDKTAQKAAEDTTVIDGDAEDEAFHLTRFYLFSNMEAIIQAAHALGELTDAPSSLFQNPEDGNYFLILRKADMDARLFNKACNILSEYGIQIDYLQGMEEYFTEHLRRILSGDALTKLAQI